MNSQDKNKAQSQQQQLPKAALGEVSAAKSSSGWKRLFSKKWVTPSIFLATAAIIVTLMWIYQGQEQPAITDPLEGQIGQQTGLETDADGVVNPDDEAHLPVGTLPEDGAQDGSLDVVAEPDTEQLAWPVAQMEGMDIKVPFYDASAPAEEREQALVQEGNTFTPHVGLDIVSADGAAFDVLAAMSGTVSHVQRHATNGLVVEITHDDGLVTVYQGVSDAQVEVGDEVLQGTHIAKAGRNELEKDHGLHLHFEVREDGQPINPLSLIEQ